MMKFKKIFIILILILIPNIVLAEETEHNHIVSIEKFQIVDKTLTVGGYAFISHQDNWGILEGTNNGNLRTYIVAYVGDWKDDYATGNSCKIENGCLRYNAESSARDLYWSRCIGNGYGGGCTNAVHDFAEERGNANKFLMGSNCSDYDEADDSASGSACLYKNVGFSVSINLETLLNNFSGYHGNSIKFKIVSVNYNRSEYCMKPNGKEFESDCDNAPGFNNHVGFVSSDLIIYGGMCTYNGDRCVTNSDGSITIDTGVFSITSSPFSYEVHYDAQESVARQSDGSKVPYSAGERPTFRHGIKFNVLSFTSADSLGERDNMCIGGGKCWKDSLFQLDSVLIEESTPLGYYYIVPAYDGLYEPEANTDQYDYYAFANYVSIIGEPFTIVEWEPKVDTIDCSQIGFSNNKVQASVDCGREGSLNQCGISSIRGKNDRAVIFVKTDDSCSVPSEKIKVNGQSYLPIEVFADLLFNQNATFKFGNIVYGSGLDYVRAGRGFELGTTIYENEITWLNSRSLNGKPYYNYNYQNYVESNGSCELDSSFNINDYNQFYYYDSNDNWVSDSLENASFMVVDKAAREVVKPDLVNNIKFKSCNSNGNNNSSTCVDNPTTSVSGSWTGSSDPVDVSNYKRDDVVFGKKLTYSYTYSLANSYVKISGNDYSDVIYGSNNSAGLVGTGKKYYVDFKWIKDRWPFDLANDINPSFIRGMNWNLNGTCDVDVKKGYYTDNGLSYKYRSISLNNPFPKANANYNNIAINWLSWYGNSDTNKARIANTYDNGVKYSITINKISGNRNSISSIQSLGGNYISMNGVGSNGHSSFVDDKFTIRQGSNISYCGLGYFSTNCDG